MVYTQVELNYGLKLSKIEFDNFIEHCSDSFPELLKTLEEYVDRDCDLNDIPNITQFVKTTKTIKKYNKSISHEYFEYAESNFSKIIIFLSKKYSLDLSDLVIKKGLCCSNNNKLLICVQLNQYQRKDDKCGKKLDLVNDKIYSELGWHFRDKHIDVSRCKNGTNKSNTCGEYYRCNLCLGKTTNGYYNVCKILEKFIRVPDYDVCSSCNNHLKIKETDINNKSLKCTWCQKYIVTMENKSIPESIKIFKAHLQNKCTSGYFLTINDCLSCT